ALALTGIMGTAVMAESSVAADNGNKKTSKVFKVNKKSKLNKKKRKYVNKTTKKHRRSGNKYNA
ncbi:MAG TPA: hypothetical protein VNW99_04295, partial [Cytophagaceae bacterium]|nr:hypothetical protein [Cytophagaceae bacterium]